MEKSGVIGYVPIYDSEEAIIKNHPDLVAQGGLEKWYLKKKTPSG